MTKLGSPTADVSATVDVQYLSGYLARMCYIQNSVYDVFHVRHLPHRLQLFESVLGTIAV